MLYCHLAKLDPVAKILEESPVRLPLAFRSITATAVLVLPWLNGCRAPAVRLTTEEPLQVDITMRVDIYQHQRAEEANGQKSRNPQAAAETTPESRRRNRMADIQEFKNSRLVGEGREGLLVILELPPGEYGQFVSRTVAEENSDRMAIMRSISEKTRRPLLEVQRDQAAEWRRRSFTGEWIQLPEGEAPGDGWQQKPGGG